MDLIGYVRVSTDEQFRNGHSLADTQPETLARYCELHGHRLVAVISDNVSGSQPLHQRPGGRALIAALAEGQANGVVVVRLDRLFRDTLDGLRFFETTAADTGCSVHSVSQMIDTSTPEGYMMLTITLAAARYERDVNVRRAQDSTASLRRRGRVFGHVPYGLVALGEGDARRLFRCPEAWAVRERIANYREQGDSYGVLRARLFDLGIGSPTGERRWSKSVLKKLCESHDLYTHLPFAEDCTAADGEATDTGDSHV